MINQFILADLEHKGLKRIPHVIVSINHLPDNPKDLFGQLQRPAGYPGEHI
jgi:hypothetical protein